MPHMWADTLELAERAHLLRLLAWGAASVLAGTGLLAWLRTGARHSDLLRHFAIQSLVWGLVEGVMALLLYGGVTTRDIAAATRLDRLLWLNIGLDLGLVLAGTTLALAGWRLGRQLGVVGAGLAVVLHGCALSLLGLILAARISR